MRFDPEGIARTERLADEYEAAAKRYAAPDFATDPPEFRDQLIRSARDAAESLRQGAEFLRRSNAVEA